LIVKYTETVTHTLPLVALVLTALLISLHHVLPLLVSLFWRGLRRRRRGVVNNLLLGVSLELMENLTLGLE
jgi:hypothetical protein